MIDTKVLEKIAQLDDATILRRLPDNERAIASSVGIIGLKDLWHQKDEEPEGYDEWILLHYNVGNYYSLEQVKYFKSWKEFIERAPLEKWLFLDDLFPKEGGNQ